MRGSPSEAQFMDGDTNIRDIRQGGVDRVPLENAARFLHFPKAIVSNTRILFSKHESAERPKKALEQPSRRPKSSMSYDSDTVTGRDLAEVDDFEVVRGAVVEADTYLGYPHRSLGDRRRMLKSTNGGTLTAA